MDCLNSFSRTTLTQTVTRQTFHSFTIFCLVTDIDECTTNAHDCHLNATCSNTDGSFTCSCNQGYSGDGKQCDGMFVILGGVNMTPGRLSRRDEFTPVPSHGSTFVYMIPPQKVMPARVAPA